MIVMHYFLLAMNAWIAGYDIEKKYYALASVFIAFALVNLIHIFAYHFGGDVIVNNNFPGAD